MSASIASGWTPSVPPTAFDEAVALYRVNASLSEALPEEHGLPDVLGNGFEDTLVDAACRAMDFLIEQVRAPSLSALAFKMDLARWRCGTDGFYDDYWRAAEADIAHLSHLGVKADFPEAR